MHHDYYLAGADDWDGAGDQATTEPSNSDEPTAGLELSAAALFNCVNAHHPAALGALVAERGTVPTAWHIVEMCERSVGKPWIQTSVAAGAVEAVADYLSAVFGPMPVCAYEADVAEVR